MSDTELNDAIRWKVTQLRPFALNIEEVVYNHIRWQNPKGPTSTQQRILLVCVSRQVVQETVSLLQEVGLRAVAIEVAPISLVNLDKFRKSPPAGDEIVMRLDIGAKESAMVITRGDTLYFCRSLALTSEHMTKQIARHCQVNEVVAEELKRQHGLSVWSPDKKGFQKPEDKPSMVYHSLISSLENLVVDIEHSFKYFSYQVTQSQITKFDRLILSGGGSGLKNLERFLNARLGVPVERTSPFSLSADFAVCAGLVAGQKIEEEKRINLVPREAKKGLGFLAEHLKEKPVRATVLVVGLALLLIVVQLTRSGFYGWRMNSYTKEVRKAQVQLGRLQSSQLKLAEEEGRLLERKAKLTGRLNLLDEAVRRPEEFSKVLAEVASLLPDEIWATKLLYSEKKLNITGATSNMNLIMELVETLKSSDNFTEAAFSYSQKDPKANVYNFEVLAEVKQ